MTSNMHLVLDATFTGRRLNRSIWDTCYPWANPAKGCTNFSNPEVEWYMPSQVKLANGVLNLAAKRIPTEGYTKYGTSKLYDCRSGMVTSHPGLNFKYGYVQIVARIPAGADLWPALWLEASNFHWPPEIDMLEHWGPPASYSGMYFHPVGAEPVDMHIPDSAHVLDGWHTFAIDWTRSRITWYLDGHLMFSVDQNIPHQKMYLIANVAAFVRNGVSSCDGTLQIQSVRVWQP
jgi:beta-glucanase (GH16 family)